MTMRSAAGMSFGRKPLVIGDALARQKRGHRRVDIVVLPGDGESAIPHGRGDRPHGRAADAEKMDVFERMIHKAKELTQAG